MYWGISAALSREKARRYVIGHPALHPNAICIWRVLIGLLGMLLYFVLGHQFWGILFFTISAFLDGVDGLVARRCDLVTEFGEEIDPLCDKLTYLPPMGFFAYQGLLPIPAFWTLTAIEFLGQFVVRYLLKRFTSFSVQANNFGKIKAVLLFALIIYLAVLDDSLKVPDFTTQLLYLSIIMSLASIAFKAIPNRLYADILSILNLLCGTLGITLVLRSHYVLAALAILAGQVFDLFDGRMAEKHGGTRFGPWLDDIADLVSFGLCPALLMAKLGRFSPHAVVLGALYFLAVSFRLWRFVVRDKRDQDIPRGAFNGLPSPAGALVALGTLLFWQDTWISWVMICATSFLLVSHIRFVHFGRVILPLIPRSLVILLGFLVLLIAAYLIKSRNPQMLGGVLLGLFAVYGLAGNYRVLSRFIRTGE
ncbi:MAG: CDP-alcohol phosphatidyltransferase family protein [Deltaproteobacteria bacterium]|nr:CDP-alcohol phosphatidyltransferase family protein [Deltaproteobacteria bacterium]